jgi:hypothetical protein
MNVPYRAKVQRGSAQITLAPGTPLVTYELLAQSDDRHGYQVFDLVCEPASNAVLLQFGFGISSLLEPIWTGPFAPCSYKSLGPFTSVAQREFLVRRFDDEADAVVAYINFAYYEIPTGGSSV